LGLIAIVIAILLAWTIFTPGSPRSKATAFPLVSVNFVGYTNDSSGRRLAKFAVNNLSERKILRSPHCVISVLEGTDVKWLAHRWFTNNQIIRPGDSEILQVSVPTNEPSWRISLLVYNDARMTALTKWDKGLAILKLLPRRNEPFMYSVNSGWVREPEQKR